MSTYAAAMPHSMPRVGFKRPKFDRDQLVNITRNWWDECKAIMQAACPFIPVPSPLREALPAR